MAEEVVRNCEKSHPTEACKAADPEKKRAKMWGEMNAFLEDHPQADDCLRPT